MLFMLAARGPFPLQRQTARKKKACAICYIKMNCLMSFLACEQTNFLSLIP